MQRRILGSFSRPDFRMRTKHVHVEETTSPLAIPIEPNGVNHDTSDGVDGDSE